MKTTKKRSLALATAPGDIILDIVPDLLGEQVGRNGQHLLELEVDVVELVKGKKITGIGTKINFFLRQTHPFLAAVRPPFLLDVAGALAHLKRKNNPRILSVI